MGPRPPPGRSSTSKSGARWSLPITLFLLFTAAQQSEPLIATPNLELAMMGYDPLMADIMEQPDQGRKWRLFTAKQREPLYVEKKDCLETRDNVLNYFVDEVQQSRCSPSWTEAVVHTYEEYKRLTSASISFATEEDATTPLGATTEFNFKDKAGYASQNNPNAVFIRNFFNESQREAILVKAVCVTHTVSILPFHEPVFTPAFESALYALHEAAMETNLKTRRNVLRQFVRSYGTHFARTTHFGYAAYFVKLISVRARSPAEEAVRRQRVLESARETLTPGGRRGCETTAEHFSRVVAGKFGEEGVDELVTETGSALVSGADDCDLAAKESPRPVAYILEKISSLFKETRGASQWLETRQLNVTALPAFFEEKLGEYSQEVVEKEETLSKHLCSWRRSITTSTTTGPPSTTTGPPSTTAGPPSTIAGPPSTTTGPPSTTTGPPSTTAGPPSTTAGPPSTTAGRPSTIAGPPSTTTGPPSTTTGPPSTTAGPPSTTAGPPRTGQIIIVGGRTTGYKISTLYSEALFGPALPQFPVGVIAPTLSRAGDSVYSCGGFSSSNEAFKNCWVIDTGTKGAAWRSFDIPWKLIFHSAVVVQDEIWFFTTSMLCILDTRNPANAPREISLGFSFDRYICAVAHGSKTFLIGVGKDGNEVYVNRDHSKPEQWGRFSTLLQGRSGFGCHEFGGQVFVTGGYGVTTYTFLSSAEAISVEDGSVRSIGSLGGPRVHHKMAIIEGRHAVLGGFTDFETATIETYDEQTNSWVTLDLTLAEPRFYFGLTQFLP